MIKFSITIPSYRKRYLEEAICSVINQTCKDWELIIVDDHSPESLHTIVHKYDQDQRIHYYRNATNCGSVNLVDNWNKCLSLCSGDYVICMGDDDRLLPNCLEEYNKLIKQFPNRNVYHARTRIIDDNGNVTAELPTRNDTETMTEMLYYQWTEDRQQFIGDFLFSREWLNANNGYIKFPLAYASDWATANLAAKDNGIANTNTTIFEYRDNPASISRSQNLKITATACDMAYHWYENLLQQGNEGKCANILPSIMRKYFISKMGSLIFFDCLADLSMRNLSYWFRRSKNLFLPTRNILLNYCKALLIFCKHRLK